MTRIAMVPMLQPSSLILAEAHSLTPVPMKIPVTVTLPVTGMWMELMQPSLN
jgi:hypothetical protein